MTLDINFVREAVTVASFLAFVAILAYAIHPRNRARFDEASRLPFADEMNEERTQP